MSLRTDHHVVGHHPPLRCRRSVVGVRTRLRTPGTCERRYRSDYAGNPDGLGVVVGGTAAPARGCWRPPSPRRAIMACRWRTPPFRPPPRSPAWVCPSWKKPPGCLWTAVANNGGGPSHSWWPERPARSRPAGVSLRLEQLDLEGLRSPVEQGAGFAEQVADVEDDRPPAVGDIDDAAGDRDGAGDIDGVGAPAELVELERCLHASLDHRSEE